MNKIIDKFEIGKTIAGFPFAFIECKTDNFSFQYFNQKGYIDVVLFNYMNNETVSIKHDFGENAWVICEKKYDKLYIYILHQDFSQPQPELSARNSIGIILDGKLVGETSLVNEDTSMILDKIANYYHSGKDYESQPNQVFPTEKVNTSIVNNLLYARGVERESIIWRIEAFYGFSLFVKGKYK